MVALSNLRASLTGESNRVRKKEGYLKSRLGEAMLARKALSPHAHRAHQHKEGYAWYTTHISTPMRHTNTKQSRSAQNLGQFCAAQYRPHGERNRFLTTESSALHHAMKGVHHPNTAFSSNFHPATQSWPEEFAPSGLKPAEMMSHLFLSLFLGSWRKWSPTQIEAFVLKLCYVETPACSIFADFCNACK